MGYVRIGMRGQELDPSSLAPHSAGSRGRTSAPVLLKTNCRIHLLGTLPPAGEGANFHSCAAWSARLAKYRLGPGESKFASTTLPEASTATATLTLIFPWIVLAADWGTSGKT